MSIDAPARHAPGAPAQRSLARVRLALQATLAALVAVFLASTLPGVRSQPGFDPLIDGWLQGSAYVVAAALCWMRPIMSDRRRGPWAWIAAGVTARAIGFVFFLAIVRLQTPLPYPSIADAAWLLSPLLLGAGLVGLARYATGAMTTRLVLDGLTGAFAISAVVLAALWSTLEQLTASGTATSGLIVNLAYPVTDLFLLLLVLAMFTVQDWRPPASAWVLGAGISLFAICDAVFVYQVAAGTFRPGTLVPALALLSTAAIATAPFVGAPPMPPGRTVVPPFLAPLLAALVSVALLLYAEAHEVPWLAVLLAAAVLLLAATRAALTLHELQTLTVALDQERHRAAESESRMRAEASRLGAVLSGVRGYAIIGGNEVDGISFFSDGAQRLLGYSAAEVIGRRSADVFHVRDEIVACAVELGLPADAGIVVAASRAGPRRWTYVRKDGSTLPVELVVTPLPSSGEGVPVEYVAVAREVTHETDLERFQSTRDSLVPALVDAPTFDAALRGAVRAVAEGMGWKIGALWLPRGGQAGAPLSCRHLWIEPSIATRPVMEAFAALRMEPAEGGGAVGRSGEEGHTVWLEDFTAVQVTAAGETLRGRLMPIVESTVLVPIGGAKAADPPIGVLQLFGERRAQDEDAIRLLESIASTIGRHIEAARFSAALLAARDEAETANRAKSDFISRISHELRTPLNAILGFAQLLEYEAQDDRQRERSLKIISAGRHLVDVIDDLLDLAVVEQSDVRVSLEAVSATQVLQEVVGLMGPLMAERGLELELDAHEGLYRYVNADFQRLRQILLNLMSNAIKYNGPRGKVRVSFEDAGDRLRFVVTDTGPGIPQSQVPQLFRPFERLGAERGPEQGSGLGLVVSRGLAVAMGGHLELRSTGEGGSTFVLELGQVAAPAIPASAAGPARPDAWPTASWPPATVLYVEDNLANIELVEDIFSLQPATELVSATLGEEGLELARAIAPDLILLDVQLPDIDGDEVLRQLRADPATAPTPVIVLSADASAGLSRRFLGSGAAAVLSKPLDVPEFVSAVAAALASAGAARAGGGSDDR